MDIVIPLLTATGTDHGELRYALRSFEKYLTPEFRLVLITEDLPEWIAQPDSPDLLHVKFRDDMQPKYKDANIFLKMRYYFEKINPEKDCIFCNDDYFLLTDWNPFAPYPNNGTISQLLETRKDGDPYKHLIYNTINIIGPDALNFDVHAPMAMSPHIFRKVFGISGDKQHPIQWSTPYGFLFKSLYAQQFEGYQSPDVKFNRLSEVPTILMPGYPFFSTHDVAYGPNLINLLENLYPKPSRYE